MTRPRCEGCGEPFEPGRRDRRHCKPACRTLALARRRAAEFRGALEALEALRGWLATEVARWEQVAARASAARSRKGGGPESRP